MKKHMGELNVSTSAKTREKKMTLRTTQKASSELIIIGYQ